MDLKKVSKDLGAIPDVNGKPAATPPRPAQPTEGRDQVELSDEAKGVLSGQEAARALDPAPAPVREERIAEARARVAERYYDRPEVRNDILTRLLRALFGLHRP